MPRLDTNNPVNQTLVNLRHDIASLVAKSVSRDRNGVTSLKVLNSWDTSTFEISQVFLHPREGQDLSDKAYTELQNKLDNVLGLIDGCVNKDILLTSRETSTSGQASESPRDLADKWQHPMLGYQKLEALVNQVTDDEDSIDPSLWLHLPKREEDSAQIEIAVTAFNASDFGLRKTAEQLDEEDKSLVDVANHVKPKLDTSKYENYIKAAKKSQACVESLLQTFTTHVALSKCAHKPHFIKLPILDPVPCASLHEGFQHRVFVSNCKGKDEWQETICDVVSQSASPSNSDFQSIDNICKTNKQLFKYRRKLNVLVHPKGLEHDPKLIERIAHPPFWPTLSLEEVLQDDNINFTTGNKIVLAANLARALLRMCSGDMPVQELTASNLFFLFNPNNSITCEGYNPYLACPLALLGDHEKSHVEESDKHVDTLESESREDSTNPDSIKFPLLVSFGELLMEIAMGRKMGPYPVRVDIDLLEEIDATRDVEGVVQMVGKPYVEVIKWCLEANQTDNSESDSDSDSDSEHGSDSQVSRKPKQQGEEQAQNKKDAEKARCRDIMLDAVASLEGFAKVFVPGINTTSPFCFKAQNRTPRLMTVTKAWGSIEKVGRQEIGGPVLDSVRLNVDPTDLSVTWAENFFDIADKFYQSKIRSLPVLQDSRIRVAVLDTGLNYKSNLWKGRKAIRSKRDSPIREMRHFVGNSVDDEQGHGTNVAAIISKIAPEADLYIAKVSQGGENEGTEQIIRAIDWAVKHNVHVVNMSFYLRRSEGNAKVRKKIEVAASNGMLFVAAAANYGNNDVRGFPAKLKEVICVYAVDGMGCKSKMNPPMKAGFNFSSLGVAVRSEWDTDEVYLEGTSYAASVVTGMISNVLRFVQYAFDKKLLAEKYYKEAFSSRGMSNILAAMATCTSDGHHYIPPDYKIWRKAHTEEKVVDKITAAMEDDMD